MTDTNNSPLEGNVLFYTNPEPLDQSVHGGLGVNPVSYTHLTLPTNREV